MGKKEKTREELQEKIRVKKQRKRYKVSKRNIVKDYYKMTDEQKEATEKVAKRRLKRAKEKKRRELKSFQPGSSRYKRKKRELDNLER